jgi:DNA repair ATPase RecN
MPVNVNTGTKPVVTMAGLNVPLHDYISFSPVATPTNGTQTITFKVGGSGGDTVATLVLTYSGGELASVAKS